MSYAAEQNVIATLLVDNGHIEEICEMLHPEMFSNRALALCYTEFLNGFNNNYSVDVAMLEHKLQSTEIPLEIIINELRECLTSNWTNSGIKENAQIIIDDYKASAVRELVKKIEISSEKIDTQINGLLQSLEALKAGETNKSKTIAQIARENKDLYFKELTIPKLYLGFQKLDDLLCGLEGGDVIVIGARPAVGKSAFVTQIASYMSVSGKRVGFYNLEMKEKQIYERFIASTSGIGLTRLRRATRFLGDEKDKFFSANETIEKLDNLIITSGSKTAREIKIESKHMGYDVLIIDYLQLIKPESGYKGNRYAEVGEISRTIKSIAMDLNIPVILLSQLNRVSTLKTNGEPTMAELRESGDIEQDASVIILLWNLDNLGIKKGCKIEKDRQGNKGSVVLRFDGALMKFVETNEEVQEVKESTWTFSSETTPFD